MSAVAAIAWAWAGYTNHALGHDKLVFNPWPSGGDDGMHMAATAIDGIDTLVLAGIDHSAAMPYVERAHVDISRRTNFFEAVIRILGGLLSAEALTKDQRFKEAAQRVGDELVKAFNGLPCATLLQGQCVNQNDVSIAVAGSNVLEFSQLSAITGDEKYRLYATFAFDALVRSAIQNGNQLPSHVDVNANPRGGTFSYGGESDSFWEYVLKFWIYDGCRDNALRDLFNGAVINFKRKRVQPNAHLDCFFPGLLALSYLYNGPVTHLLHARRLMQTCLRFYDTPTGMGAENSKTGYTKLRPEVMESLYVLYFVTGSESYRNEAVKIMVAIQNNAKRPEGGYCGADVVTGHCPKWPGGEYRDEGSMPSYFLAETLKYYLLFSHYEHTPLTHVFTTEAHLMPLDLKSSLCTPREIVK